MGYYLARHRDCTGAVWEDGGAFNPASPSGYCSRFACRPSVFVDCWLVLPSHRRLPLFSRERWFLLRKIPYILQRHQAPIQRMGHYLLLTCRRGTPIRSPGALRGVHIKGGRVTHSFKSFTTLSTLCRKAGSSGSSGWRCAGFRFLVWALGLSLLAQRFRV